MKVICEWLSLKECENERFLCCKVPTKENLCAVVGVVVFDSLVNFRQIRAAANLFFASESFSLISNHAQEHFISLEEWK